MSYGTGNKFGLFFNFVIRRVKILNVEASCLNLFPLRSKWWIALCLGCVTSLYQLGALVSDEKNNELWIGRDVEEIGCGLFQCNAIKFVWRNWVEARSFLARLASSIGHMPKASAECFRPSRVYFPAGDKRFASSQRCPDRLWGPPNPPVATGRSTGGKMVESWGWPPPSHAVDKNEWICTWTPSCHAQGKLYLNFATASLTHAVSRPDRNCNVTHTRGS